MQSDGHGVGADPQHQPDTPVVELVPGHQPEQFLVVWAQAGQGHKRGSLACSQGNERDRITRHLAAKLLEEPRPALAPPSLIGNHPASDSQQPGQRVIGNLVDLAPGDGECLSRRILGVGGRGGATQGVRQDPALMRFEQLVQARDSTVPRESPGSHRDGDAPKGDSVPREAPR